MSKCNSIKLDLFINNKFEAKYRCIDKVDLLGLLRDLWTDNRLTEFIQVSVYANICYPYDRNRIDDINVYYCNTFIANAKNKLNLNPMVWKSGYQVHIYCIDPKNIHELRIYFPKKDTPTYNIYENKSNNKIIYDFSRYTKNYNIDRLESSESKNIIYSLDNTNLVITNPLDQIYHIYLTKKQINTKQHNSSILNIFSKKKGYCAVPNSEIN